MITPFHLIFLNFLSRKHTITKNDSITCQKSTPLISELCLIALAIIYITMLPLLSGFLVLFLIFFTAILYIENDI